MAPRPHFFPPQTFIFVQPGWLTNGPKPTLPTEIMGKATNTLIGFISGIAVGAVVGMLYAPDKGNNTRDRLSYRLDKYRDALKSLLDTLAERKEQPLNSAKADSQKVVGDIVKEAEKIHSAINDLEGQIRRR
jgi:gas vesicle protein